MKNTIAEKPRRRRSEILWLKITLEESQPLVWRRVLVRSDITLHSLHRIIQVLMGWYDYHLYEFFVRGRRYEAPHEDADGLDAKGVTLGSLALKKGEQFSYIYDFGDHWSHEILLEKREPAQPHHWLPWVEGGERAAPPEDCGGIGGFQQFLEAIVDPDHPEHDEWVQWSGEDYDPARFDRRATTNFLRLLSAWGVLGEK